MNNPITVYCDKDLILKYVKEMPKEPKINCLFNSVCCSPFPCVKDKYQSAIQKAKDEAVRLENQLKARQYIFLTGVKQIEKDTFYQIDAEVEIVNKPIPCPDNKFGCTGHDSKVARLKESKKEEKQVKSSDGKADDLECEIFDILCNNIKALEDCEYYVDVQDAVERIISLFNKKNESALLFKESLPVQEESKEWNLSRERMPDFDGIYYVYGFMHHPCGNVTPFHKIVECRMNQWIKSDEGEQMTCWRPLLSPPIIKNQEFNR